jgi:hypothetical protein
MNLLRKLLLPVFSFALYLTIPVLIILSVLHSLVFEDHLLSNQLENAGFYEKTTDTLVEQYSVKKEDFVNKNSLGYLVFKKQADEKAEKYANTINTILKETITTNWLKGKVQDFESGILSAIQGNADFTYVMNISDLQETILTKFDSSFTAEERKESTHKDVRKALEEQIPTSIDLQEYGLSTEIFETMKTYYAEYEKDYQLILYGTIIVFVLGLAISLLTKHIFRWTGYTFTTTGISILIFFFSTKYLPTILEKMNITLPNSDLVSNETMNMILVDVTTQISNKVLPFAILVFGLGMGLYLLSFVPMFKPNQDAKKAA